MICPSVGDTFTQYSITNIRYYPHKHPLRCTFTQTPTQYTEVETHTYLF